MRGELAERGLPAKSHVEVESAHRNIGTRHSALGTAAVSYRISIHPAVADADASHPQRVYFIRHQGKAMFASAAVRRVATAGRAAASSAAVSSSSRYAMMSSAAVKGRADLLAGVG